MTTQRSRQDAPSSVSESAAGGRPVDQVTDAALIRSASWARSQAAFSSMCEAREHELHLVAEAAELVDADLQLVRRRQPAYAGHADPVVAIGIEPDRGQVDRHVGSEVVLGLHLVHQLGGHRVDGDQTARAALLGDHAAAVLGDLGDREAQRGGVARELEEAREVATGGLGAALEDVTRDDGAGQLVVLLVAPAVLPGGRSDDHRGVGDPARDHDVGAPTRAPARSRRRRGRRSRSARPPDRARRRVAPGCRRRPRRSRGGRPCSAGSSSSFATRPAGLRPPAFATIRTPFSSASPRQSETCRTNVRA